MVRIKTAEPELSFISKFISKLKYSKEIELEIDS